jgi:general L-amino acid transport system permease protein
MTRPADAPPLWRNTRVLAIVAQALFVVLLVVGVWTAKIVVERSMARQNIRMDWTFFRQPAGFQLTALGWTLDLNHLSLKQYSPEDSYAEAMIAGLFNTVKVAVLGIILAMLLGLLAGVARLSRNWLLSRLALVYVEVLRNTPLLVQLFFWYFAVLLQLPQGTPDSPAITLANGFIVLTNRGLAIGGALSERFGRLAVDGGFQMTSEFAALVLGLAVYTSAFIAEIIRGGILAIPRGQTEAARSLGLSYRQALRLVVLPQALRIIIPPLGNQCLNLTKNSSLAIGVGFADLLTASMTVASQSFRALETFTFVTLAYLAMSLLISAVLNVIRARLALPGT